LNLLVAGSYGPTPDAREGDIAAHLLYEFEGISSLHLSRSINVFAGTARHFRPKIFLTVEDDLCVSAGLSPETKKTIENLMSHQAAEPSKIVELDYFDSSARLEGGTEGELIETCSDGTVFHEADEDLEKYGYEQGSFARKSGLPGQDNLDGSMSTISLSRSRTIQIRLHADSEFFDILTKELSSIDDVQTRQKDELTWKVKELGHAVQTVAEPSKLKHSDLYVWRQIFSLYREASVFFGATERDRDPRTVEQARERVQWFADQLVERRLVASFSFGVDAKIEVPE
jgi:E3 ubiquitin-protein ligase BAH